MKKVVKVALGIVFTTLFLLPNIWIIYQVTGGISGPVSYQIDIIPIGTLKETNTTLRVLAKVIGTVYLDDYGNPVTGADVSYEFVTACIDGSFTEESAGVYKTQLWLEIDVFYEKDDKAVNSTLNVYPLVPESENWVLKVKVENANASIGNLQLVDYTFEGGKVHYFVNTTYSSIRISGVAVPSPHSYQVDLAGQVGFAIMEHHSELAPVKGAKVSYEIPGTEFKGEISDDGTGKYNIGFSETIILKILPKISVFPETVVLSTNGNPVETTLRIGQEIALASAENIILSPTELENHGGQTIPSENIVCNKDNFDLAGASFEDVTIEVTVPDEAPPGIYSGSLKIQFSGSEMDVPVTVCNKYISQSFVKDYVFDKIQDVLQATIGKRDEIGPHKDGYLVDRTILQQGVDLLSGYQKRSGSFANIRATCLAISALLEAEKLGYSVDRSVVQRALDWLMGEQRKRVSIDPREKQALLIAVSTRAQELDYSIDRLMVQGAVDWLQGQNTKDDSYGGIKISSWVIRSLALADSGCYTVDSTTVQSTVDWLMSELKKDLQGKLEDDPNAQVALMALVDADDNCYSVNKTLVQSIADVLAEREPGIYYGVGLKAQALVKAESATYSINRTEIQNQVDWLQGELVGERVVEVENVASVVEALVVAEHAGWANKLDWKLSKLQPKLEDLFDYMQEVDVTELTIEQEIEFYQNLTLELKQSIFKVNKLLCLEIAQEFAESIRENLESMNDALSTALVASEGRIIKLGGTIPAGKVEVSMPVMIAFPERTEKIIPYGDSDTETIFVCNIGNLAMLDVTLRAEEDIAAWTTFDMNDFDVEIHECVTVNATMSPTTPLFEPILGEEHVSTGRIVIAAANDGNADVDVEITHLIFTPIPTPDYVPPEIPKMDPVLYEAAEEYEEIWVAIDFYEDPTISQIVQLENMGVEFTGTGVPVPDYSLDTIITPDLISELEQTDFIKRVWSYTGRGASTLLDRSVPLIGGSIVRDLGYNGSGIPVAVIDTGIAHYHNDITEERILSEHDYEADTGRHTSIAVDSNGHPHISYYYRTEMTLRYARYDGSQWIISTIDENGPAGQHCSITLDSNDNPHISYRCARSLIQDELRHAWWDGSQWNIEVVDSPYANIQDTSIALDSNDHAHIVYSLSGITFPEILGYSVTYAGWDGSNWQITRVEGSGASLLPTHLPVKIEIDVNDDPHIAYFLPTSVAGLPVLGTLHYAVYEEGVGWWRTEVESWLGGVIPTARLSMVIEEDSDGDGLTDTEELTMGLDPNIHNDFWALIISGSLDGSFSNNTQYMYHVLSDHFAFDSIYYLDVHDSRTGVNASATIDNVRLAINTTLASWSDDNDIVFIYFSSHGGGYLTNPVVTSTQQYSPGLYHGRYDANGDEGLEHFEGTIGMDANGDGDQDDWIGFDESMQLQDGWYWDDELARDLNTLQYKRLIFIRQGCVEEDKSCFGGGLIDDISATDRIIMTATNETIFSWGDGDSDGFSEWSEAFIDALHGRDATWHRISQTVIDEAELIDADANNDGHTSMIEAWQWAWENDDSRIQGLETPWLDDNGNGLPTYINGADETDSEDGALAAQTWFPSKRTVQHVNIVYKYNVHIRRARLLNFTEVVPYAVSEWDITDIDTVSSLDVCPSMTLDSQGGLHVSYGDYTDGRLLLNFATWNGDEWSKQTVDSMEGWAILRWALMWTSTALDSNDKPHIAYYDNTIREIRYATKDAFGEWITERLESIPAHDTNGHGTHVAGIIGASGTASGGRYVGVAPGVSFVILKLDLSSYEYFQSTSRTAMHEAYHKYGTKIQSNSWGWFVWNGDASDPICQLADSLAREGAIIVVAAGNEGEDGVRSPGSAKNVITIGAVTSGYYSKYGGPASPTDFSSQGPSQDDRRKPDITAPGYIITSLDYANLDGYTGMSGTSMAAPHVTGIVAILLQAYDSLYGIDLKPEDVKAILLSSAVGGLVEMTQALIWDEALLIDPDVSHGGSVSIPLQIDQDMTRLTITVTWADPPAPDHNNIDAYLYDATGVTMVANSTSVTDTVERIVIDRPATAGEAGIWLLNLYGREVDGTQPVAVSICPSYTSVDITQCPDSVDKDDTFTVQVMVDQAAPPSNIISPIARDNEIPARTMISLPPGLELVGGESYTKQVPADGMVSWTVLAKEANGQNVTVTAVSEVGSHAANRTVTVTGPPPPAPPCTCAVATASTGTSSNGGLNILRRFRDQSLQPNPLGEIFVQMYYQYGARIAWSMIERHELRSAVRIGFVEPMITTSDIALSIANNQSLSRLVQIATFAFILLFITIPIKIRRTRVRPPQSRSDDTSFTKSEPL